MMVLHFSLELGKMHAIHIPTIDIEDDIARCVFSDYVEAGAFLGLVKNLSRSSIVKMKEMVQYFLQYIPSH